MASSHERELRTVAQMIRIYCRHKEGNRDLCPECMALLEYARERLARCPFADTKSSCRKCRVHCYGSEMRARIRAVMRYSGPRMVFYSPVATIRHLLKELLD